MQDWQYDVIETYESIENVTWAFSKVAEYNYRKLFGLSKKEFNEEPVSDFIANAKIAQIYAQREKMEVENARSKG